MTKGEIENIMEALLSLRDICHVCLILLSEKLIEIFPEHKEVINQNILDTIGYDLLKEKWIK